MSAKGNSELIYAYTVTGSDKASIDTGVDAADAGSTDWTNGDVLEVEILARTDDAAALAVIDMTLNNDSSAIYDTDRGRENNTTVSGGQALADTRWQLLVHGTGGTSGYASSVSMRIPGYAATTFNKTGFAAEAIPDSTAGNNYVTFREVGYRSTTAITRLKIACQSTAKFKVGTQIRIYKRISAAAVTDSKISDLAAVTDFVLTDEYVLARSGASQKQTAKSLQAGIVPTPSSSPPSSPVDGQLWLYPADASNGVNWLFRYNSAEATYKWEFIGGPPLFKNSGTTSAVLNTLTQVGSSGYYYPSGTAYSVGRAGDYEISGVVDADPNNVAAYFYVATYDGSTISAASKDSRAYSYITNATAFVPLHQSDIVNAASASDNIGLALKGAAASTKWEQGRWMIRPVRVI